jgi:hypothetical protein
MTLPEVFKAEDISETFAEAVVIAKFTAGRRTSESPELDWKKAGDGCWYAAGLRFTPAIAKLGDLQGAFEFVGRKGPATHR